MATHYEVPPSAIIHTIDEEKYGDSWVNRSEMMRMEGTTSFRYSVLLEDFWNWDDEDEEEEEYNEDDDME